MILMNISHIVNRYNIHIHHVKSNKHSGCREDNGIVLPNMLFHRFLHIVMGLLTIMSDENIYLTFMIIIVVMN